MPEELPAVPVVTPIATTVGQTPDAVIHVGHDTAEIPPAALHSVLSGLDVTLNKLNDTLEKAFSKSEEIVEEPVAASTDTAEDIAPEVIAPKPDRYIRRNGRRVKRG